MSKTFLIKQNQYKAKLFKKEKRHDLMIKCLKKACELDESKENYYELGVAYYSNNNYEKSMYYLEKAYSMGVSEALTNIGLLQLRKNNIDEAVITFNKALKEGIYDALFGLFMIAKKRGDINKQKEYLMQVVEKSDNERYPLILANIYFKEKDYDNFIKYAEMASLRGNEEANYRLAQYYLFIEQDINKFIDYISNCYSKEYIFLFAKVMFDNYQNYFEGEDLLYLFKCIGYDGNYLSCLYAAYIMSKQNSKIKAKAWLRYARDFSKDLFIKNEIMYLIKNNDCLDYFKRLEALLKNDYTHSKEYINSCN